MMMFALRGMLGRKLRTVLTALAIILGVAMISGTFVLTDSISSAFNQIFTQIYKNTDAVITGKSAFGLSDSGTTAEPSFDESLLPKVLDLPGVQNAIGGVSDSGTHLVGKDGKSIHFGGAPNLGFSVDPSKPQFNSLQLVEGSWPQANEVVVDTSTARKKHLVVGQPIGVQVRGPVEQLRISGLVKLSASLSIGGATLAGFDLRTAQSLFDKPGKLDDIRIAAKPGVSSQRLLAQVRSILPPATEVRTGSGEATHEAKDTQSFISFLQKFLLAFGGVALFVGSFVIANSLSITIAQRTREFATLRTLGASRKQVRRSVLIEALVLGVLASLVGLFLGLALAKGLFSLFNSLGFTLPNSGLPFRGRTIIVSLLVGIAVTVVASMRPAFRATRVPPIAAVREGAVLPPGRFARYRPVGSSVTAAIGFAALLYGLFGAHGTTNVIVLMLVGALLIFIGVALFAAHLVQPLAHALGWPATRIGGAAGSIARDNAQRNPQRTASTAAALMIGLALVTLVATLAAGIIKPFTDAVDQLFTADYAITAQNNFDPIPPSAARAAAQVPGVAAIASVRGGDGALPGVAGHVTVVNVTAVEPETSKVIDLKWQAGTPSTIDNLGANGAVVSKAWAKDHHLTVGSQIPLLTPSGQLLYLDLKGIFAPPTGGSPFGNITISSANFDAHWQQPLNLFTFIKMKGGVTDANTKALSDALDHFPNAKVQTRKQFKDNQIGAFKQVLNILYVLLALSVVISLFGIVNTLVLTVFERTRELGMLRAIGMTRRQVRRMIRHESVITALIGAVLGLVLGVVLGALFSIAVKDIVFAIPWTQLVIFTIVAIVIGILAAIFPARRAAKLNPLEALHYE